MSEDREQYEAEQIPTGWLRPGRLSRELVDNDYYEKDASKCGKPEGD